MTTNTNQTAAEKYREILASRRPTYTVTAPSGMEFTLRAIEVQDYFLANQIPFQIANKLAAQTQSGKSEEEVLKSLPHSEQMAWLEFVKALVCEAMVEPKVEDLPFILQEDFTFLIPCVMGGEAGRAAATFRGGSRPFAVGSSNGKKRGKKSK